MYYRFTNSNNPMSDWGHAMFAADRYKVEHYGANEFTLDKSHTVSIYDLESAIINAWDACKETGEFGQIDTYYTTLSAEEVFETFCPSNIVDSANGYDCDLVCWLWNFVLDPKNIMAVRTDDGAVCFDESLIKKVGA